MRWYNTLMPHSWDLKRGGIRLHHSFIMVHIASFALEAPPAVADVISPSADPLTRVVECRKVSVCEPGPSLGHTMGVRGNMPLPEMMCILSWVCQRSHPSAKKKMAPHGFGSITDSGDEARPFICCPSAVPAHLTLCHCVCSGKPTKGRASGESGWQREVCLFLLARPALDRE